jgi:hypothetical protein
VYYACCSISVQGDYKYICHQRGERHFHTSAERDMQTMNQITSKFFGLKKTCLHLNTHAPYIVSLTGGKENSVENLQISMSLPGAGKQPKLMYTDRMV